MEQATKETKAAKEEIKVAKEEKVVKGTESDSAKVNVTSVAEEKPIPLLSQLFSQTATNDPEELEKERKKEEEENRKEKENAWKKMKIGYFY